MSELLREFPDPLTGEAGVKYHAQVHGTERPDGKWEGRIGFVPASGTVMMTARESLQSDQQDLRYWAMGLTQRFVETSLARIQARQWEEVAVDGETHRLEVTAADDRIAELLGTYALTSGVSRITPGNCRIAYESTSYTGSDRRQHTFELTVGDDPSACATFLCDVLGGSRLIVDDQPVAVEVGALTRALSRRQ